MNPTGRRCASWPKETRAPNAAGTLGATKPLPQPPHLPAPPTAAAVGRYGNGVIATPAGVTPTGTVATTVLLAVDSTNTLPDVVKCVT